MKAKNGRNVLFCGASQNVENVLQGVDAALFVSYTDIEEAERKLVRGWHLLQNITLHSIIQWKNPQYYSEGDGQIDSMPVH